MAINVQFQNLSQANNEILKAFNSANSAKALEAYQPLDAKQRKLEKLRALQILQQSSSSQTLASISLDTNSLSLALTKAEGATLQAMLNLLSAKMIEQNKYTYVDEKQQIDLKQKVQKKLDERKQDQEQPQKQKNQEKKKDELALDKLVDAAVTYFKEIQDAFIEKYKQILSGLSLENIQKAFAEGISLIKHYTYEVPIEFFSELVIQPIKEFRKQLVDMVEDSFRVKAKTSKTFSSGEIKTLLQQSLSHQSLPNKKLSSTVDVLDKSLVLRQKIQGNKKIKVNSAELKLALHR